MYNILMIDDEMENLDNLDNLLRLLKKDDKYKFRTIKVNSGEKGLQYVASQKNINLIILDVNMPGMDGFEVAKRLQSNPDTKKIPIIFITASFISDEFIQRGFKVGAVDYFTKPVDTYQFLNKISLYLNMHTAIKNEQRALSLKEIEERFLANVSHDIKTPLNGILGSLELLKNRTKLDNEQKNLLDISTSSAYLLLDIVNEILDFSKLNAGKLQLHKENRDIIKELQNLVKIFESSIEEKKLEFELNIDKNIPQFLYCDIKRLKQVFMNLLSNAIKFTEKGKVTFDCDLLSKDEKQATIKFSITDTGRGISTENQNKIFEPFLQEDNTIAIQFGGTGLGTNIAKNIVELHNSKLELQSKLGVGSSFYFTTTFDIGKKIIDTSKEEEKKIVFKNSDILIAEDNYTNQLVTEMLLEDMGLENTHSVDNGEKAFIEYKKNYDKYKLILMDINMPILSGVEATSLIIKFELENGIEHTPIVALTANSTQQDIKNLLNNGLDDYIMKPIQNKELTTVLQKFLEQRDTQPLCSNTLEDRAQKDLDALEQKFRKRERVQKLLESFFSDMAQQMDSLTIAYNNNDLLLVQKILHTIKGASGNLELSLLYNLTIEAENKVKNKSAIDFNQTFELLNKYCTIYKKKIKSV